MSSKRKDTLDFLPWREYLSKHLRKRQPAKVTAAWLEENRWWWKHVEHAVTRHCDKDFPSHQNERAGIVAGIFKTWRSVQLSAFLHELERRFQGGKQPAWPELPKAELLRLAGKWMPAHTAAGHDTPLMCRRLNPPGPWLMEAGVTFKDPKTNAVLWNKYEPAWTDTFIFAANLNVGDKAILK